MKKKIKRRMDQKNHNESFSNIKSKEKKHTVLINQKN